MDLTINKVTEVQSSSLTDFDTQLSTITKDDAIEAIKAIAQQESEDWFRVGMVLSAYKKSKGDDEFKHLLSFAEENLGINSRKAYYLMSIHDNLVASEITPSQVSEIGWTKLKEIAHLLNQDNLDHWVEVAKSNTTKQLVALIKSGATNCHKKSAQIDDELEDSGVASSKEEDTKPTTIADEIETDTPVEVVMSQDETEPIDGVSTVIDISPPDDPAVEQNVTKISSVSNTSVGDWPFGEEDVDSSPVIKNTVESLSTVETDDVVIDEEPLEESFNASDVTQQASSISLDTVINTLQGYDYNLIVKTITEIYPHMTITVSEKNNAEASS